jgi:hypothetical protein
MTSLDFEYAPIAAWLSLMAFGFLLWRYPSGLAISGFLPTGLGWVSFGNLTFVRVIFFLQVFALLIQMVRASRRADAKRLLLFVESRQSVLFWVLLIALVKVAVDLGLGGVDEFRREAIITFAYQVALPSAIFLLTILIEPPRQVTLGLALGLITFSLSYVLPLIPAVAAEGRLQTALGSIDRLTSYGQDPINGGRFFFFGALGALATAVVGTGRKWLLPITWIAFAIFQLAVLLNGTRQYILALGIAVLLYAAFGLRSRWAVGAAFFVCVISAFWVARDTLQLSAAVERLSSIEVSRELRESRGAIWIDVAQTAIQNPLLGVGFCRYGQLVTNRGRDGDSTVSLSGAHGFFQDIFAEHGVILGVVALAAFAFVLQLTFGSVNRLQNAPTIPLMTLLVLLSLPYFISGALFNGLPIFLLALAMVTQVRGAAQFPMRLPIQRQRR